MSGPLAYPDDVVEQSLAQPTPFLQRYYLLRFGCGERTNDAAFLSRWFERIGPLTRREAEVVAAGWSK